MRTVATVQGRGQGDRVTVSVHDREVRCLLTLRREGPRVHVSRFSCLIRVEPTKALSRIAFVDKLCEGYRIKVGVTQVLGPVRVRASLGFNHQVHRADATVSHRTHVIGLDHVEDLNQQRPAG